MSYVESMPVGVVVARQEIDNPWQDHIWRPVEILPGAPAVEEWTELARGDGWVQYHAATVPLELFRKDTEAYMVNLEGEKPVVYVVLAEREDEDTRDGFPYAVRQVTASPFDAQDYLDADDAIVEPIRMPQEVAAWVAAFIDEHHVEETFKKRKRDEVDVEEHKFGQEPLVVPRERMAREAKAKTGKGSNGGS
jgi:hypothetical protein